MKLRSKLSLIRLFACSRSFTKIGSLASVAALPPKASSQLDDALMSMSSPVISDFGRATGKSSPNGARVRFS